MFKKYLRFFRINLKKIVGKKEVSVHSVAMGLSVGIFWGFSPLLGLQTAITLGFCFFLKYSKILGFLGTLVSNPFTIIPIYLFNYWIGHLILGKYFQVGTEANRQIIDFLKDPSLMGFISMGLNVTVVLLFGSFFVGLIAAIISYFTLKSIIIYYRKRKQGFKIGN